MTAHAVEEMAEDGLDIVDMEHVVLAGRVVRIERDDPIIILKSGMAPPY
jgi:hypothetical protein